MNTNFHLKSIFNLLTMLILCGISQAQDVTIYSKSSDESIKSINSYSKGLGLPLLLEVFNLKSLTPLSSSYSKFKDIDFKVSDSVVQAEMTKSYLAKFKERTSEIKDSYKTKIPEALTIVLEVLATDMSQLQKKSLKDLESSLTNIRNEEKANNALFLMLKNGKVSTLGAQIEKCIKFLNAANNAFISKTVGLPIKNIKDAATEKVLADAKIKYPDLDIKSIEADAIKKYYYYKVGDKVKIEYAPTPNRSQVASGTIRSIDAQRVKINFNTILINDIINKSDRRAMNKLQTFSDRKLYVASTINEVKINRRLYYDRNLQLEADKLISENIKNGYLYVLGAWVPVKLVISDSIKRRIELLRNTQLGLIEKYLLADGSLINTIKAHKQSHVDYFAKVESTTKNTLQLEAEQAMSSSELTSFGEFTEEDFENLAEQERVRLENLAEQERIEEKEKKRKNDVIAAKKKLVDDIAKNKKGSSLITIISLLLIIALIAGAAFNSKIRNKLFGDKKKKNMRDLLAPQFNEQVSTAVPPIAAGTMSPKIVQKNSIEKTKIELDDDLSIERGGGEEGTKVSPSRKKIALNLGSAGNSGGELTPPGDDKSNLILNPNLSNNGDKIRLKK